jgi:hypothetical protein
MLAVMGVQESGPLFMGCHCMHMSKVLLYNTLFNREQFTMGEMGGWGRTVEIREYCMRYRGPGFLAVK